MIFQQVREKHLPPIKAVKIGVFFFLLFSMGVSSYRNYGQVCEKNGDLERFIR